MWGDNRSGGERTRWEGRGGGMEGRKGHMYLRHMTGRGREEGAHVSHSNSHDMDRGSGGGKGRRGEGREGGEGGRRGGEGEGGEGRGGGGGGEGEGWEGRGRGKEGREGKGHM